MVQVAVPTEIFPTTSLPTADGKGTVDYRITEGDDTIAHVWETDEIGPFVCQTITTFYLKADDYTTLTVIDRPVRGEGGGTYYVEG